VTVPVATTVRLACGVTAACLAGAPAALAFPPADPAEPSVATTAAAPDESDLRHQLQRHSEFGSPLGGGWTFTPSITLQEAYTDNILNTQSNRRWDLLTLATPGIAINGDTPRAQVRLNYGPQFRLAARTPEQDNVTQQLQATGLFTVVPDALYVDARAFAGSGAVGGGFGALGLGVTPALNPSATGVGSAGLSNQNQVQSSSLSIAPYWLHRFGETGTAKIGYQFSQSAYAQGNSFVPLFFPTGSNASYSTTHEGVAQFITGEQFAPFRNFTMLDARLGNGSGVNRDSQQYTFLNRLGYLLDRNVTVFGELGYENLQFNATPPTRISDAIWGVGTTITPNPDSQITIGFGHRYGQNAFNLNGSYALSARTRISASYNTGLQSDLQYLQSQLDLLALDSTGRTIDAQTGAPLYIGTGGIGVQSGLFRTKRLVFTGTTLLDRDQISLSLQFSQNTTLATAPPNEFVPFGIPAPPVGSTSRATTVFLTWLHQVSETLSISSSASYSASNVSSSGNQQSLAASVAMQYLISETVTVIARYAYFNRQSNTPGQSFYQNLVLVGISKQF